LQQALQAGEAAYAEAAYDIALTYWRLGRILKMGRAAEAALQALSEARQQFETLADGGNSSAERMVTVAMAESGDCLTVLGRLDNAASVYEEALTRSEKLHDQEGVAVKKIQLATVRLFQRRYPEALASYAEAREMFTTLNDPNMVAGAWHQIGIVHRYTQQFDQAEQAYRHALAIRVQQNNLAAQADSLAELGNLYAYMSRTEQAVTFYRQAAEIAVKLQDRAKEGTVRRSLAIMFIILQRSDEARQELQRTIACEQSLGHAVGPWKTWSTLCELEREVGNPDAAAVARQQASDSYRAYRRAGGENQDANAPFFAVVMQAIASGETAELEHALTEMIKDTKTTPEQKVVCQKLLAVLKGNRDLALASDPELNYQDAVELQLLLEQVSVTTEGHRR
jgi:tetratricopeptide (TPR) repeat protein